MQMTLRNAIVAACLGAAASPLVAAIVLPLSAPDAPADVTIDNFTFAPPS